MPSNTEQNSVNAPLLKEAVVLRHEEATLRGYPNHVTYALRDALLKTPGEVQTLLKKFHERVGQNRDLKSVIELKRTDDKAVDKTVYFWDYFYYSLLASRTSKPAMKTAKISDYFPFKPTIRKMLALFGELFGLVFEEIDGEAWSDDVEAFSVWDDEEAGGAFSGYLYLDCYPRPGKNPACKYLFLFCLLILVNRSIV